MFLSAKNTQEIYDNIGDNSGNKVTKLADEFSMDIFNTKDNPR